jgi:predicted amidohydrolase
MKIAIAQITSVLGNLEKNMEKHLQYCEEAIKNNADLVIFPELSLTGYSLKDINLDIAVDPFTDNHFKEIKKISKKISIICGFAELGKDFGIYNSAGYFEDGDLKFVHRKIYPPTYGLFEEFRYFSRGKDCRAFDTKFGRIGVLICEDLWHLSLPYTVAMDGAKIIIGIAASPTRLAVNSDKFNSYEINADHHRTYGRILSCYLVFCNRVGFEDGINFWGGSEVVDPFGNVVKAAKLLDEEMIYAGLNMNDVKWARQIARHFLDEDLDLTIKNLKKINS